MKNTVKNIWVLVGHTIPKRVEAFSVFIGKPTKEQLLQTSRFDDNKLDNQLIKCLLKHNICGTYSKQKDFRYEYMLIQPDNIGDLNLDDLLYTGALDMHPHLLIEI